MYMNDLGPWVRRLEGAQPNTGRERTRPRPQPQENVQQPTLTTGEKIRQWLNTLFRCVSAIVDIVELVMEHC